MVVRASARRRIAAKFDKFVTRELHPDGISDRIREDIRDTNFLTEAIQQIVRELAPGYPAERIQFSLSYDGSLFQPNTNIEFQLLNVLAPRDPAVHPNPIGIADLLVWIYSSRASVELAAAHNADLGVHPLEFRLATLKLRQLLEGTVSSEREIGSFQQFVMPEGASLREIINSGNRTFAEVVALVDKAKKFRTWVRGRPADSQLLREYITEVTKIDWLERLPTKVLRWLLFTGIGLAVDGATGALGGIAVSAADEFLLDRLLHGWRPNEFIEGPLREFVKSVSSAEDSRP